MEKICSKFKCYYNNYVLNFSIPFYEVKYKYLRCFDKEKRLLFLNDNFKSPDINDSKLLVDKIVLNYSNIPCVNSKYFIHFFGYNFVKKINNKIIYFVDFVYKGLIYKINFYEYSYHNNFITGSVLNVYQPSIELLQYLEDNLDVNYNISQIEYALDLYSNDNTVLFNILAHSVCQKNAQVGFCKSYSTTQYACDIRKAQRRGVKIYHKFKSNDPSYVDRVRIESTIKTNFLNSLNSRKIMSAAKLKPEIVFSNVTFKIFNLISHIISITKKSHIHSNNKDKTLAFFKIHCKICQKKFFESLYGDNNCGGLLAVKKNKYFKKFNISNSLDEHPFDKIFKTLIKGKSFY